MLRKIASVLSGAVHQLPPTATVYDAACLMKEKSCGAVLITAQGKLDGIFTKRDLVIRVVAAKLDPALTALADVMTRQPNCVRPTDRVIDALRMMEDGGYRHLPVTDKGQIVGIVSRRDFFGEEKAEIEKERRIWENIR